MRRSRLAIVTALTAATVMSLAATSPAAATTVKGHGWFAKFDVEGNSGGIVLVDRIQGNQGRLNAVFAGLLPSEEYFVVGRSINCSGTPAPGNRTFRLSGMTDAGGTLYLHAEKNQDIESNSVWIGPTDGSGPTVCSISFNFDKMVATGDINGDGAAGLVDNNSNSLTTMALVERRPNGKARLTIVINAGDGNDEISVRGVNRPCGKSPTHTAFKAEFTDVLVSSFKSTVVDMSQAEIDGLRSMRVFNKSTGDRACAPLSIIAILIG